MTKRDSWILHDFHYWLPRAKQRIEQILPHGKEYRIDPRWPDWAFDTDDIRHLRGTKALLYELTLESEAYLWIIAGLRVQWNCESTKARWDDEPLILPEEPIGVWDKTGLKELF